MSLAHLVPFGASFFKECVFMNSKKGLNRIMSALLAATSFVGQASAAPAKKKIVKKVKNVGAGVGNKKRKKEQNEKIDVGGRKRRGKAISAYVPAASPFEDPRNWAIAVLCVSILGLGITAFCKHRKALEHQADVALFCTLAELEGYNMSGGLMFCRLEHVVSLGERVLCCGGDDKFYYAVNGTLGDEVKGKGVIWSDSKFFRKLRNSGGVFVGPVARTLEDDINVFVDRCLLKIIREEFGIEVKTNKNDDRTVANFRDHLMQSVGKKYEALRAENKLAYAEGLRKTVGAVFRGADWVREYLYKNLSRYEKEYNERFKPKNGGGRTSLA